MKKLLVLMSLLCVSITAQAAEPIKNEIQKVQPTQTSILLFNLMMNRLKIYSKLQA